jgi:hypothetical protein
MTVVVIFVALCLQILFHGQYAATLATYLSTKIITIVSNKCKLSVSNFKAKTTLAQAPNFYLISTLILN